MTEVAAMFATLRARAREALVVGDAENLDPFAGGAVRFGFGARADIRGEDVELGPASSRFRVGAGVFTLPVPGAHNVANALAAIAACRILGVTLEDMVSPLASFRGIGRRFQTVGRAHDLMNANRISGLPILENGKVVGILTRRDLKFRRVYSHPVDRSQGLLFDQTIVLTGVATPAFYPERFRRVGILDPKQPNFCLLTNYFGLPASTIAALYKHRWKIELFFRWIKQHLHIKSFFGTSRNAVMTQIWIAMAVYALVAIVRKEFNIDRPLYTILQVISVNPFSQTPLNELLKQSDGPGQNDADPNQLILFE
jgi:hypothetical protein